MRNRTCRRLGIATLFLTAAHILIFSPPSALKIIWLVRRHRECGSSEPRWRNAELSYPRLVSAVSAEVPRGARLTVRHGDRLLAHEIAFYDFPREVVFEEAGSRRDQPVVSELGPGEWLLTSE